MKTKPHARIIISLSLILVLLLPVNLLRADNEPLTFTALNGTTEIKFHIRNVTHVIQYKTDDIDWSTYVSDSLIVLNEGESVSFRAETNQTEATAFGSSQTDLDSSSRFVVTFSETSSYACSGNIMSLYGPDCPDLPLPPYAFSQMFYTCAKMATAPLLPATKMGESCYSGMFDYCWSLTEAPALPSTDLAVNCYAFMFCNCWNLLTPPVLNATKVEPYCYCGMFSGCYVIESAPALPADTMKVGCYNGMFSSCYSIATPPTLPARALASACYTDMFNNCTSLVSLPQLPAVELATYCYRGMFNGCSSLVVNTEGPGRQWCIPGNAVDTTDWNAGMLAGTGGTFTGNPAIGVTYYVPSDTTTAVENPIANEILVYSHNGIIRVEGAEGESICVYDVNGCLVAKTDDAVNTHEFTVEIPGVYFVKASKRNAVKVIVATW